MMNKFLPLLTLCLLFSSCSSLKRKRFSLDNISRWGYQLQNYTNPYGYERISQSHNMLWVMDPQNGDDIIHQQKVELLKQNNNTVMSYLSIGEAESYRNYFKEMPKDLIVEENKNWTGNYRVKYWDSRWQVIIISQLDKIVNAGFDGVYLDIVDAYDYYEPLSLKKQRAQQMQTFIKSLHDYAIEKNPDFVFIQQNGLPIVSLLEKPDTWFELIDGVGIESMFFSGSKPMNNDFNIDQSIVSSLKDYQARGIPVFSIEYIDEKSLLEKYEVVSKEYNVIPLAASKLLDGPLFFFN